MIEVYFEKKKRLLVFVPVCVFKVDARLLIEKYLSLKKENIRGFIVNVQQHTTARPEVTSIFSSKERSL